MKKIIRSLNTVSISFWVTITIINSIELADGQRSFTIACIGLFVVHYFVRPIAKTILLHVNFIFFGLLSFILTSIYLYLLVMLYQSFQVSPFYSPVTNINGYIIPEISLSFFLTILAAALVYSFTASLVRWILH